MKRILIAGDCNPKETKLLNSYLNAVFDAGGLPAVAVAADEAQARAYAEAFDALLLPGGNDMNPEYFGQTRDISCTYDDPAHDLSDRLLWEAFHSAGKRVLGICRGIQVLAVALGGTLAQDLPAVSALCHGDESLGHPALFFRPFTPCAGLPLDLPFAGAWVNSAHHQAVLSPGAARVFALAPDGTVEGIVYQNLAVGVQFHPERMAGDLFDPIWDWFLRGVSRG